MVDTQTPLKTPEMVNHPAHYLSNGMEVIDIIEAFDLSFCSGNAVKYILRAGAKQDYEGQDQKQKTIEDLKKAVWYLNRRIVEIQEDRCS